MIEDTGIVDFCFILVEWLFTPKEYMTVAPLFMLDRGDKTAVKDHQTC
jgi:hypothetical protein